MDEENQLILLNIGLLAGCPNLKELPQSLEEFEKLVFKRFGIYIYKGQYLTDVLTNMQNEQ